MIVCCYGAFGRHNFGDILFPHIFVETLKTNININNIKFIFCDLFERDMRPYGGHDVKSIADISKENITHAVVVGGEVCGCSLECGVQMFDPVINDETTNQIKYLQENIKEGCYILDRNMIKNPNCIMVANSIGHLSNATKKINQRLKSYNYVSTRDSFYAGEYDISPDCAVLTKKIFNDKIMSNIKDMLFVNEKYIAIQASKDCIDDNLIENIKKISDYYKLPIYLFAAGLAPGHDSFEEYEKKIVNKLSNNNVKVFKETNVWKICCLIANSHITIGSSLHVRILAFDYSKIRFTITKNLDKNSKHYSFINKWDNITDSYIESKHLFNSIKELNSNKINEFKDDRNLQKTINQYEDNVKKYIHYFK